MAAAGRGLLSLCDGLGTARLAVGNMLEACGAAHELAGLWFAESDHSVAAAVAQYWAHMSPPHTHIAGDVRELMATGPQGCSASAPLLLAARCCS